MTEVISIRPAALPARSTGASEIVVTTPMPSTTRPKTVNWPSRAGCGVTQRKNCAPALSRFPGTSTDDTAPRTWLTAPGSNASILRPPVPYCAAFAGSFDSGSPPWMMPCLISRWNVVPL